MSTKTKAIAINKTEGASPLEVVSTKPTFLTGTQRGSENVEFSDLTVPRLELVQPLSPCKNKQEASYIPGATDGMIFNTITRHLYGDKITVVPVFFRKSFLLFRSRKAGAGFRGSFDTPEAAENARKMLERPEDIEIVPAHEHFVMTLGGESLEQVMLTCTKTKLKASRALNSFVQMRGEDRFSSAYEIFSVLEKNDKGSYYNFGVRPMGFVSERIYNEGMRLWKAISSGATTVRADMSDIIEDGSSAEM